MNKRILPFAGAIMLALGGTAGFAISDRLTRSVPRSRRSASPTT